MKVYGILLWSKFLPCADCGYLCMLKKKKKTTYILFLFHKEDDFKIIRYASDLLKMRQGKALQVPVF